MRYHPENLSRVFVPADGRTYVEARYADLRRPAISLWEQRAAVRALRAQGEPKLSEQLLFKAMVILAYVSAFVTLRPGDVIVTGTPGGVGVKRNPPRFLRPGDMVEVEIGSVGRLVNPVRKEARR